SAKRFGSVSGVSAKPVTFAPMRASQSAAHPPLKPVCPVRRTRFPLQKEGSSPSTATSVPPKLPRRLAGRPKLFEIILFAQRIHGLPESGMREAHEFAITRQTDERIPFECRPVALDPVQYGRLQHEKSTIDPDIVSRRLFDETLNPVSFKLQGTVAARRDNACQGRFPPMLFVERKKRVDVDIADTITIGHEEALVRVKIVPHALYAPACQRFGARVHKSDAPWLAR